MINGMRHTVYLTCIQNANLNLLSFLVFFWLLFAHLFRPAMEEEFLMEYVLVFAIVEAKNEVCSKPFPLLYDMVLLGLLCRRSED